MGEVDQSWIELAQYQQGKKELIPQPFRIGSNQTLFEAQEKNGQVNTHFVSRHVPYITKEFHNVENQHVYYEIEWKNQHKTNRIIIPAKTLSIRKDLLELSDQGLGVNENNVKKLIQFFDQYQLQNEIEQYLSVDRLGKINGKFVHPLMSDDLEIMAGDIGEKQLLNGFDSSGEVNKWIENVFNRVKDQPKALFMVLASFASPIIQELKVQPFIVDLSGTTSQGKTTVLKAASSVWGTSHLINEWNATRVSIERKAAFLNNFPIYMDDTRKANEKVLGDVVYQFSGGRSKGRGSISGSQKEFTWHNILLSTGEVSLINGEQAKKQGGVAARVIPLEDEPLRKDIDNVMKLNEAVDTYYGAVGVEFIKAWQKHKDEFLSEYHAIRGYYIEQASDNEVLSRLSAYYAAVHFVAEFLNTYMNFQVDVDLLSEQFQEIKEENKQIDKPMQFLQEILEDLDSKRDAIFYEYMPKGQQGIKAIFKDRQKQLFLTPSYLSEILGTEEKQIRREWLKRGITAEKYTLVKHKGKTMRGVPINKDLVANLGFDFQDVQYYQ